MPTISARAAAALLIAASVGAASLAGVAPALAQAFPADHSGDAKDGGLSRAQALGALMGKGYSNVGTLKTVDGGWTGEATKGGATNIVTVDKDGKITTVKQ